MPMRTSSINRYVLSNVSHRPVRTLLSVLAIAVEVTMILTLVGLSYGTLDATARRTRGVGADIILRPPGSSVIGLSTAPMPDRLLAVLMKQPHVALAVGTVVQPLAGLDTITGLDLPSFDKMSGGFRFLKGGPFRQDNNILVDEYYAREHHLRVGDAVHLINRDWHLAGIFESGKLTRIAVKLPVLQQLTGNPNHLSQIFIKVDDSNHIGAVVDEIHKVLPGYPVYTMEEFTSLLSISSVGLLRNFIGVVIGIAVVVGFIVVYMAMYTAVLERTREIGILKSMGASSGLILRMLLQETLLFACFGVLAGILLTYATQWTIAHLVPSSLNQETVYAWWPLAAAIAIAGALLGAIVPVTKAVRQDVTQALAYE
jgi:putative ABC transport system permease protein